MRIALTIHQTDVIATILDHPRLPETDVASVRIFLCTYSKYARKGYKHACRLTGPVVISAELTEVLQLKFCGDFKKHESFTKLILILRVTFCDAQDGNGQARQSMVDIKHQ